MLTFDHGEPHSVAHTPAALRPGFWLPSEVHSASRFPPPFQHRRLSAEKETKLTHSSSTVYRIIASLRGFVNTPPVKFFLQLWDTRHGAFPPLLIGETAQNRSHKYQHPAAKSLSRAHMGCGTSWQKRPVHAVRKSQKFPSCFRWADRGSHYSQIECTIYVILQHSETKSYVNRISLLKILPKWRILIKSTHFLRRRAQARTGGLCL